MEIDHHRPLVVFGAPSNMTVKLARRSCYRRAYHHQQAPGRDDGEPDYSAEEEASSPRYVYFIEHDGGARGGPRSRSSSSAAAASNEAILVLKEVAPGDAPQSECAVCLNEFRAGETLRAMPCSHTFHLKCIFTWLMRNGVCPLCRHQLPTEEEEERQEEEESVREHLTLLVLLDD